MPYTSRPVQGHCLSVFIVQSHVCEPPPFDKANASKFKSCLANILLSVVACNPLTTSCQLRRQQMAGKKVADEYKSVLI